MDSNEPAAIPAPGDLTRRFVELLLSWPADAPALRERCRLHLLDGLAVAAMGAREAGPALAAALAAEGGAEGHCTLIARRGRATPWDAARINGMAMHVLDYEPMWIPPNHAISPLLPALLALSEVREHEGRGPQGAALLRALAIGIEAQGRLRLASGQLEPAQLTFHPPGVVGPIAAAIACAALLGLDMTRAVMAAGIAASRTGGLLANVGSHTKALHCGDAAANGLQAALLAARGFGANEDALGSPRGFGTTLFADRFDPAPLVAPLGAGRVLEPGCAWKLFPSQFATHFAITAALDARARLGPLAAGDIESVRLTAPQMPYIDRPRPATGLEGKFSWQYTAALALLDGEVSLATFSDARRRAPDVDPLLGRIALAPDSSIPGGFDRMHVEIEVTCRDGRRVSSRCDAPLGSWRRPIPTSRVERKARELLGATVGEASALALLEALGRPDPALQVSRLMALLAADAAVAA